MIRTEMDKIERVDIALMELEDALEDLVPSSYRDIAITRLATVEGWINALYNVLERGDVAIAFGHSLPLAEVVQLKK